MSAPGIDIYTMPMPQEAPSEPSPLSTGEKTWAAVSTALHQAVTSIIAWALANKLPAAAIVAALTQPMQQGLRNLGYEPEEADALGTSAAQLISLLGHIVAAPLTGYAHRHTEALVTSLRLYLQGDGKGRLAGVGLVPSHEYRNKKETGENIFVGTFGIAGFMKGILQAIGRPGLTPAAAFGYGVFLDVMSSGLAGMAAQAAVILNNPERRPMVYKPLTVAVPSDPASPVARLYDGESRNRGWAAFRTAPAAMLIDLVKALQIIPASTAARFAADQVVSTTATTIGAARSVLPHAAEVLASGVLGALKGMLTLYSWFKGRATEEGVRPSGRRARESGGPPGAS